MASLLVWTAILASLGGLRVTAMPMLTEQGERGDHLSIPSSILEWYLQQRDAEMVEPLQQQQQQPQQDLRLQFKQWLDTQLARLPPASDSDEPNKAFMAPQPKRGNYMALCHFKICNMGRKRSPRIQPQDLP